MFNLRGYRASTWVIVALCWLITGAFVLFVAARLSGPTDFVRLAPGYVNAWQPDGVIVEPVDSEQSRAYGLQRGDKLIAVDGVSLTRIADNVFSGEDAQALYYGQIRFYTVLREGREFNVLVSPSRYPFSVLFKTSWAAMLVTLVTLLVAVFVFLLKPTEGLVRALLVWSQGLWGMVAYVMGIHVSDLLQPWRLWLFLVVCAGGVLLFIIGQVRFSLVFAPPATPLLRAMNQPRAIALTYVLPLVVLGSYLAACWFAQPQRNVLAWMGLWIPAFVIVMLIYSALFGLFMLMSYRANTDPVIRRKIRLVVFGGVTTGILAVWLAVFPIVLLGRPLFDINIINLFGLPLSLSIAIAIFRYRLVDIDFVINRALVYATVTVYVALIYFGGFMAVQVLVGPAAGQSQANDIGDFAVVLSTLLAVALFNPLRRWAQAWVDRRFYRSKVLAQRTLAAFGETARNQVDLAQLQDSLSRVIADTMQARFVRVWVKGKHAPPNGGGL